MTVNARPESLAEAVRRAQNGTAMFDHAVREFLDTFYGDAGSRGAAIREPPPLMGGVYDPYVAAVAEHLARCFGLPIPEWTEQHGEPLHEPFFAGGLETLKARLIVESPSAFRRRLIFVSHDALDRPRARTAP